MIVSLATLLKEAIRWDILRKGVFHAKRLRIAVPAAKGRCCYCVCPLRVRADVCK